MDEGLKAARVTTLPARPESVVPEESPCAMPEQVLWPERRKEARARKGVHTAR